MKLNVAQPAVYTHEGARGVHVAPYQRLRRTVLACMLFEDQFYEDGVKAVDRIKELCSQCSCIEVLLLALESSDKYLLRHIPLMMIVEALKLDKKPSCFADTIYSIIKRPDQMTDLLALYWRDGKKPLPHQLKKGLAKAYTKFDEYQLAKYNRDTPIKLRDVLFMCHAKPKDEEQAALWKRLVNKELKTPDTWEVKLSGGQDKKQSFEELLHENKMGKLAILRNMRNMHDSGVPKQLVADELNRNMKEMLPFQYLAAARECPNWEDIIDAPMVAAAKLKPMLMGNTLIMVDVSGSMDSTISNKSKMVRMDAACGLAILLRETVESGVICSFSESVATIPSRRGMALRDAIVTSQLHSGTYLGRALHSVLNSPHNLFPFDRIIVITDEQSNDQLPNVKGDKNYILNIASYQNGIGNQNQWTTISGFSEASIDYIRELESLS